MTPKPWRNPVYLQHIIDQSSRSTLSTAQHFIGFSDEAIEILDSIMKFTYMGKYQYEVGTPEAFKTLTRHRLNNNLINGEIQLDKIGSAYYLCHEIHKQGIREFLTDQANENPTFQPKHNMLLKDNPMYTSVNNKPIGWVDIINPSLILRDKTIYTQMNDIFNGIAKGLPEHH